VRRLDGRFALEREIGAGGMSVVFLGRDEVLDRPVAVKVLRGGFEEDSGIGDRFRREGRTAARLSHPNIVQVYDAGEDELDGRQASYIVMEYVPRGDLKALLDQKGPLSEKELARIGADVASGLAHAHEKGIVHRDIKPQNILLDSYGRPKLSDFGIARAVDATHATRTGSYLGTALYSSPEQLRGGEVTSKSDVYSLGVTLYEAAVGEPPFSGNPIEVASQQLAKSPIPPRSRGVILSGSFEALILSCLAKEPTARPDAASLQERLLRASAAASGAVTTASGSGETTTRDLADAARGIGAAGVAGVAGAAKAAGERGFDTVVRGARGRGGSDEAPARTLVARRPFRVGPKRRAMLAVGAAALLLLVIAVGVYALPNLETAGEKAGHSQDAAEPSPETATDATTTAPGVSEPALPLEGAEQAVFNMYYQASFRNAEAAWSYLSESKQQEEGSVEQWVQEEQINTLTYMYFTQYPQAEASGEEARVNFQVREIRIGGVRLVTGTWVCIVEGGAWKLDRLEDEETQNL